MSKYDPLRRYLAGQPGTISSVELGFGDIERMLAFRLPASARRHRPWWANDPYHAHAVWLEAGWETREVDMASERVTFVRAISAKGEPVGRELTPQGAIARFQAAPHARKRRIGLIACTKSKLKRPAPARQLYSASDLFRKAAAYCDAYLDGWFVLSAKYGLVEPDRIIAPYDMTLSTMPGSQRRLWGTQVAQQLRQLGDVSLEAHAGADYVRPLLEAGVILGDPLRGLSIGKRKRWYIEQLARIKREKDSRQQ